MAVIRDTKVTQLTTEAANITVELPTHATDDLLLVFGAKDATLSGTLTTGTSGWTIGGQNSSTGSGGFTIQLRGFLLKICRQVHPNSKARRRAWEKPPAMDT